MKKLAYSMVILLVAISLSSCCGYHHHKGPCGPGHHGPCAAQKPCEVKTE